MKRGGFSAFEQGASSNRLLRLHLEALWGYSVPDLDADEVEVHGANFPLAYLGEWDGGSVCVWRSDLDAARRALIRRALATSSIPEGMRQMREVVLRPVRSPSITRDEALRITRPLGESDRALLESYEAGEVAYYLHPARRPVFGVVVDGRLVAVSHSSRRTKDAVELGVETRAEYRRRGYGLAVTVAWMSAVQDEGLFPFYSALATNLPSLSLARAAGYEPFARGRSILPLR